MPKSRAAGISERIGVSVRLTLDLDVSACLPHIHNILTKSPSVQRIPVQNRTALLGPIATASDISQ